MTFKEIMLSSEIQEAIEKIGFSEMTSIQEKAIPLMLTGVDIIGKSQTGTGKTLAFSIPAIEKVKFGEYAGLSVLILCPTRELVCQVQEEIRKLTEFLPKIKTVAIYGGVPIEPQIVKLRSANIVVGTPGRVIDHIKRKTLKLNQINLAILDEADEMLNMGFRDDIEVILESTPKEKQVVLFSATMPPEILAVTRLYQKDPTLIEINRKKLAVENIKQIYYNVAPQQKLAALNMLLKFHSPRLVIIFCNTKKGVDELNLYLYKHKFNSKALHGDMNQIQRQKTLDAFKCSESSILIATDVAARGIDINDIDCVINFDIPQNIEYYVHRIGRTGRAGKSGLAITLCCGSREVSTMGRVSKVTHSHIVEGVFPSVEAVKNALKERQLLKITESVNKVSDQNLYSQEISVLLEKGFSLEQIARGALSLYFGNESSDEDIIDIKPPFENYGFRSARGGSSRGYSPNRRIQRKNSANYTQISINFGKLNAGLEPKHVLGAITSQSSIDGKDIGRIDIRDEFTIVSVKDVKAKVLFEDLKKRFTIKGRVAKVEVI